MQSGEQSKAVAVGLFAIAGAILLHTYFSLRPNQRHQAMQLNGNLTGNLTGTLQATRDGSRSSGIVAAPFDPEGGAIVRSAGGQWFRIWADGRISHIGMDQDLWEHATDPVHAATHSIWDAPPIQPVVDDAPMEVPD